MNWFKKQSRLRKLIILLGLLITLACLCARLAAPTTEEHPATVATKAPLPIDTPAPTPASPTNTPLPPTATPIPIPPTPAPTWHEIARWEGKSIKNTETFHIPSNEWRISWDTKPGEYGAMNFQIYVYTAAGSLTDVAANVIGQDMDSTIMRGTGDYYLTINTAQPYVILVEARY